MKHQKLVALIFCLAIPFSVAACSSTNSGNSSSPSSDSNTPSLMIQESSSPSPTSASASSKAVSSTPTEVSNTSSVNAESKTESTSSTQQNILKQISVALDTKVPLMLPTNILLEKNRYLTATTVSQTANYKVNFYQTAKAAKVNSPSASKGTLIATLEGIKYKDAASAKASIADYVQINIADYDEFADLGHRIKAAEQAGTGHQQLLWDEGRWYIHLDFPTDPAFQTKDYPDSPQLAKNIVAYLDKNMLPAPQKIGVIKISNWNTSESTTVQWQDNQTVYQISGRDPMTALKIAVAMKAK